MLGTQTRDAVPITLQKDGGCSLALANWDESGDAIGLARVLCDDQESG